MFINYFSSGKPTSAPVQCLHDIRQARFEPLQSYLSRFNEEMLFCERISDAEALSALKWRLDMNLPFWRDICNENSATFDQLVEMITEEITNENMILYRNRGGIVANQNPRIGYDRSQGRLPPPSQQCRMDYPSDPNSRISYVASTQEGTSASTGPPTPMEAPMTSYCRVHHSYRHNTEDFHEVKHLANRRKSIPGHRRGVNPRSGDRPPMRGRGPQFQDQRSQQWDKRPRGQEQQRRRNS
ncbi:Uncharacterized protein Adt_20766 [Abeliophyllum distichum]|uniref:Retrotransposon gag domain-containing protein n=1 Tax=Abeliophyllum distichum TaxID=126358 RepID=A0ABD1SXJ8_9LAMI